MKIVLGLVIVVLSTIIGDKFSAKHVVRDKFFKDFLFFCEKMKVEISFHNNSLLSIVNELNEDSDFNKLLKSKIKDSETTLKLNYLTNEESEFFNSFANKIGRSDKENQIKFLDGIIYQVSKWSGEAQELKEKYKPLYLKLGLLFGIIAFVIII